MIRLRHNKIDLALHTITDGQGPALLALHGLGECTEHRIPAGIAGWPGPVYGLDFTGHGESSVPTGGGYTAELLLADADIALSHLGSATLVGRGLGAYIALLLAGARADRVRGAVLADGPGISGGPTVPTTQPIVATTAVETTPDPYALVELGRDLRPRSYATSFARLAIQGSDLESPITVVARFRPDWLDAVTREPGVIDAPTIEAALANYRPPASR
ncbi:MAG: alpha/beta hydrolase [Ilumatobacter coccineus]|uniref:Alpha/beta hydrolase n=1 Tax=Ilumatobacter coccineus TaxID=467094 RepID=A0A2G6KBE1_9ACTN|nr:MAG: alpha/beta hydrolase [Ilumatobacter coccineus]